MAGRHRRAGARARRVLAVAAVAALSLLAFAGVASAETTNNDSHAVNCSPPQLVCADNLVNVGPLIGGPIVDTGPIGPFNFDAAFPNGLFGHP